MSPDRRPDDEDQDFGALLDAFEREQSGGVKKGPKVGERVTARIVGFGEDSAFVDLGGKSEGRIPLVELTDADGKRTVEIGQSVEALVAAVDDDAGAVVLRVRGGGGSRGGNAAAEAEIAQAQAHGVPVEGTVQSVVKGGVEVTVSGLRGFCPISQLDLRYVEDPAAYVGQRLTFRVSRFEAGGRGRGPNVVLSRRALLEEEAKAKAAELRSSLEAGKTVHGKVSSLATYGAFIDLGGIEGLLHVSELGHARVNHPQEVLSVGQEVEVQILRIEPPKDGKGAERISLSRKALLEDPWQESAAQLRVGARRTGKVARLETFGAFIEMGPGLDGLLHISELGRDRAIQHPRDVVRVGDAIDVVVLAVDLARKRISLGLASGDGGDEAPTSHRSDDAGFGAMGDFLSKKKR